MIVVDNLTARYGRSVAVSKLSLTIETGDIYGLVGPNGAGKTTLLRCIATLHHEYSGRIQVCGSDVACDPLAAQRQLGFMPDFFGTYDALRVWEYLDFFARARKIPDRTTRIRQVLEETRLSDQVDGFVEGLSRGMQQRLGLAQNLLHDPPVLLLDEPASGLDPRARIDVFDLLKRIAARGRTILISSHILHELDGLCDKLAVIDRGAVVASGSINDIRQRLSAGRHFFVRVSRPTAAEAAGIVSRRAAGAVCDVTAADAFRISLPESISFNAVLSALIADNCEIVEARKDEADLQAVFLALTAGGKP